MVHGQTGIPRLEEALEARRAGHDACKQREETVRERDKEISALQESLQAQKYKTERVQAIWTKESDKMIGVFGDDPQNVVSVRHPDSHRLCQSLPSDVK